MVNPTEQDERHYLAEVKERIGFALQHTHDRVNAVADELRETKAWIHEHQSGLDEADQVAALQSINRMANMGTETVARRRQLMKLALSPYFGRIDFQSNRASAPEAIYIGLTTFFDPGLRRNIVYDWRAPVSSMFYDFELGAAHFQTPSGKVEGAIHLKRQYKVRDGVMEFMIESGVSIHDEVLQRELSKSADERMKTIAATIQRDQNQVIRNEEAPVMIIQGVAGSGKTSIALHRIAFMLYRFRDSIKARDVLILSPNKVFADYISNVLPELGEEQIPEMEMDELATALLDNKQPFQTFFQQVNALLEQPHPAYIERVKFKSTFEFVKLLNKYFVHLENTSFTHIELKVAGVVVPVPFVIEKFKAWQRMPMHRRIPEVVQEVIQYIRKESRRKLSGSEKARVHEMVPRMFNMRSAFEVYKDFYQWIGRPDMFRMMPGMQLEYADVFPLIYCKIRLEGINTYDHVKHLLVDEMQDYTPVQYAVLGRAFTCRKTILGDINQSVNPYGASAAEDIEEVFPQGELVKMYRAYRSTLEISQFASAILPTPGLIPLERHGESPRVLRFENGEDEVDSIRSMITAFVQSGHHSMGIICKTQRQADELYTRLGLNNVHLLSPASTTFTHGVILASAHLSKGLEFDEVVLPHVTHSNYHSDMDRRMLYIGCTRAMHRLTLTGVGEMSRMVNRSEE
ncbi:MAG: AAA family ATPase [Cyclobacteriaceae bacterium]|nr:AAA family ATPase [Cyclobacteriaceae bacterium]